MREAVPIMKAAGLLVAAVILVVTAAVSPVRAQDGGSPGGAKVELVWRQSLDNIRSGLSGALDAYRKGDAKGAADLVVKTQFDHYKNSLLETAVRRYVSAARGDYEHNAGFSETVVLIQGGAAPAQVEARITSLVQGLEKDLPGLPLIDGAVATAAASPSGTGAGAARGWQKAAGLGMLAAAAGGALLVWRRGRSGSKGAVS